MTGKPCPEAESFGVLAVSPIGTTELTCWDGSVSSAPEGRGEELSGDLLAHRGILDHSLALTPSLLLSLNPSISSQGA